MPERILWLVDEYVMKSELPERLVPIIERAYRLQTTVGRTEPAWRSSSLRTMGLGFAWFDEEQSCSPLTFERLFTQQVK
ncbi:MAG: hypothetical protein ABSD76_12390 [Terriglobales bacterium]|jgi:hypothetical protein